MLPGKTYSIDEVLRVARKRMWVVLVPLAVVSAATAVVVRKIPDQYRSDAMIVVIPQRIPTEYVRSTVTIRIEDRLQTIKAQVLSRTLLEETIKTFNLYAEERKNGALMEDIVNRMRNEVFITLFRLGETFQISYVGEDPKTVTKVTEYLTTTFINQSHKDRSSLADSTNQFLETELADAKRRLIDHELKLQAYNQRHSGELPSQQPSNLQASANLQMQIQATLTQISNLQDRRRNAEKEIQNLQTIAELFPVPDVTPVPNNPTGPVTLSAAQKLANAEAKLAAQQAAKFTEDHPEVRASRREIAQLQKEVEAEALRQPVSSVTPRPISPAQYAQQKRLQDLRDDIEDIGKEIAAKLLEEKRLRDMSGTYQNRADMAPIRASELVELTRDYATLNGRYSSLLAKKEEAKMALNLEARQIGEQFRLLDPARLPEKPIKPNRPMMNMMGLAAGFGIGLVLVGLLEYRDSSFKTDAEITTLLTLPVLAVVPLMQSDDDRERATRRQLVMSVGLGSTVLGCLAVLVYTFVR